MVKNKSDQIFPLQLPVLEYFLNQASEVGKLSLA